MSLDPVLLARSWPERRPVVLASAAVAFTAVAVAGASASVLFVLPVLLVALELGLAGGLAAAALAVALAVAGDASAVAPLAVAVLAAGGVAGRFSDRMRAARAREQRLLAQEREAVALGADLLEQRSALGGVLDAAEDDRRRLADTLHEELAQTLSAVLLGLRMLGRRQPGDDSLEELHAQVVGVLDEMRAMATSLRPTTLAQLGLVPALEGLAQLSVEAVGVDEPLPEPLRTGTYRLVENVLSAAPAGEPASLKLTGSQRRLDAVLDVAVDRSSDPVAAARAQAALLGGSLRAEPLTAGRARLRLRLPLQAAA